MKVLVVGGGGREHALVWKINQSRSVGKIFCAPGNPGVSKMAECVDISSDDTQALIRFAKKENIDLTVVGPEIPLVNGIVDVFEANDLKIFGPTKKAAEIEGSKVFSKYLLDKYKIPTADCIVFDNYDEAAKYLNEVSYPTVIKADGLAAGKGSIICPNKSEALTALEEIMVKKIFGESGKKIIVEEFMVGEEASIIALVDGENIAYFSPSQDHKAIFDGDKGPNTGGMGAYAPAPIITMELLEQIHEEVMQPTVNAMTREKRPYRGFLYAGLMITRQGPKVVEFNCRLGDPETQVLLPLYEGDLVDEMYRIAHGKSISSKMQISDKWAMCVVMAAGGYPGAYDKGQEIFGLAHDFGKGVEVFHAGTKFDNDGKVVTNGGRVLGVTAFADDYYAVREKAYSAVGKIAFDKAYYRKDIGAKAKKHIAR